MTFNYKKVRIVPIKNSKIFILTFCIVVVPFAKLIF